MGLKGFFARPVSDIRRWAGGRGRHRKVAPSAGTERLTRLLGTLAVGAAAVLGPAVPAAAVRPATPEALPRTPSAPLPADAPARPAAGDPAKDIPADADPAPGPGGTGEAPREGEEGLQGPERHVEMPPRTGGTAEQLWLLGGVALSLTAAGIVAVAAARGHRRGR